MDLLVLVLLVGSVVPACLALPGFILGRRKQAVNVLDFFSVPIAGLIWFQLTFSGIGSQSLSNIVGILIVAVGMVLFFYLRLVVAFWQKNRSSRIPTAVLWFFAIALPVGLRLLMPSLPE